MVLPRWIVALYWKPEETFLLKLLLLEDFSATAREENLRSQACSRVRHAAKSCRRDGEGGFSQASEGRQRLDTGSHASAHASVSPLR